MKKSETTQILVRKIITIGLIASIFFLATYEERIRSIINLPEKHILIDNPDSKLLSELIKPEDFSNKFSWYLISTTQSSNDSTAQIIEGATRILLGHYKGYKIRIVHAIKEYSFTPQYEEVNLQEYYPNKEITNLQNIDFIKIDKKQNSQCGYFENMDSSCLVVLLFNTLKISFDISIEGQINIDILEEVGNTLLEIFEENR